MPYVDPQTIHNPSTGGVAPAVWGDVLRDDLEFFADPPACSVFNSSTQSVNNNTTTALTADSENFDNDGMHSTVSNTSRITATTAGRYQFFASVIFAADADGIRQILFRINGTTTLTPSLQIGAASGTDSTAPVFIANITLAATNYVECMVRHTAGAALNCTLTEFSATWLTR